MKVEEIFEHEEAISFEEITPPTEEFAQEFEELKDDIPVEVEVTTKVFEIEHEGKEIVKSKITIEVPATKETLEKGEVLVFIPKEIAQSTDQITFSEKPIILEKDPLVKWEFKDVPQGSTKAYSYVVDGNAQTYKTIAVAAEKKEIKVQQESNSLGAMLFLFIVGIIAAVLIFFFRKKR
ncbi:MAG: hypothetical protein QW331_00425 [Candidatus Woesearchaeota archaeon]